MTSKGSTGQRRILSLYFPGWAEGGQGGQPDPRPLLRLAAWCGRYTPYTAADLPDGVILDITGRGADFPDGEAGLVADILRRLGAAGISCRIAVADNAAAAWGLARHGADTPIVTGAEEMTSLCRELPLAALSLKTPVAAGLARLGISRVGELSLIPPRLLARRVGHEARERVEMMLGRAAAPLPTARRAADRRACVRFDAAVACGESLAAALSDLVSDMARGLTADGVGARHFVLTGYRADGEIAAASASPKEPRQDANYLSRVLKPRLKMLASGPGFEVLALDATATEPLIAVHPSRQPHLCPAGPGSLYAFPEHEGGPRPLSESVPLARYEAPGYRASAV